MKKAAITSIVLAIAALIGSCDTAPVFAGPATPCDGQKIGPVSSAAPG